MSLPVDTQRDTWRRSLSWGDLMDDIFFKFRLNLGLDFHDFNFWFYFGSGV